MTSHSITNLRAIYWQNDAYQYPLPWLRKEASGSGQQPGNFPSAINTGWHIIPNLLWGHLANPRQWWEMVQKFEAISVKSIKTRIFNPVPIQTALSFQGQSTFPAFNNTVYSMTYTDTLYETPWFDWHSDVFSGTTRVNMFYEFNPAFKEGLIPKPRQDKFDLANDVAKSREELEQREDIFPKQYYSKITENFPASYQQNTYRRQFLPIYWYHYPFPQYNRTPSMTAWRDTLSWWENAWFDPSGTFWDPLNRPEHLGELRPGKNMIEFHWEAHPADQGIWFNTDRVALPPPYPRPRPLQFNRANINLVDRPPVCHPITPGPPTDSYEFLKRFGLVKADDPLQIPTEVMAPETHTGLPNWRDFPVVPMRWFFKEWEESNPWINQTINKVYYRDIPNNCPTLPSTSSPTGNGTKKGDVEITAPMENARLPGTEYEMYKYPPTQWFIKGIPLFDDQDKPIPVQMQAFMLTTVTLEGKPRRSALYAPSWGPILPQDLYSVNMDTPFGENYIRGRSAGARRTWLNPEEPRPVRDPLQEQIYLFKDDDGTGNPKTNVPVHCQKQCIIEPSSDDYTQTQWPRRAQFQTRDMPVVVSIRRDGRRVVTEGHCQDDICE